jgi:opacity protein-like surface antigen
MKRLGLSVVLASLFGVCRPGVVSAQGASGVHLGIAGGADFPVQNQREAFRTGWNAGALLAINFGTAPVGLRIDGAYHRMETKSDLAAFAGSGNVRILSGTANLVLGPKGGPAEPYVLGGAGGYDLRFHGEDLTHNTFSDSTTRFGWNAGAGIAFPLGTSNSRIFVEGRYISISTNGNRFSDSITTKGSRFTFVPVNLGFIF